LHRLRHCRAFVFSAYGGKIQATRYADGRGLCRPEFKFLPRSFEALHDLTAAGFVIIVITNPSALPPQVNT